MKILNESKRFFINTTDDNSIRETMGPFSQWMCKKLNFPEPYPAPTSEYSKNTYISILSEEDIIKSYNNALEFIRKSKQQLKNLGFKTIEVEDNWVVGWGICNDFMVGCKIEIKINGQRDQKIEFSVSIFNQDDTLVKDFCEDHHIKELESPFTVQADKDYYFNSKEETIDFIRSLSQQDYSGQITIINNKTGAIKELEI